MPHDENSIPCIFLDRDGVINRKPPNGDYVTRWAEFEMLPGVSAAIRQLNQTGYKVVVVTNQRGISHGLYSTADLDQIHTHMQDVLAAGGAHIDAIYYCPHDQDCRVCRKPADGMFRQAFADFPALARDSSVMIGDSPSDMQAARAAGLRALLISADTRQANDANADAVAGSLADAVTLLICARELRTRSGVCSLKVAASGGRDSDQ